MYMNTSEKDLNGKNMFGQMFFGTKVTSGIVTSEKDCKSIKGFNELKLEKEG